MIILPSMRGILGGFSPLSLSPALWFDSSDPNTLYDATTGGNLVAAGGQIARWEDKSGNARHATQSVLANRPIRQTSVQNGRDIVRFDGSSDFLDFNPSGLPSGSSQRTALSVFKHSSNSGAKIPWLYGGATQLTAYAHYKDTANIGLGRNNADIVANRPTNSFYIISSIENSGAQCWVNGTSIGTSSTQANTTLTFASLGKYPNTNVFFDSDLAEVIIFPTALSTTNRQRVERYLGAKWGITVA